MKRIIINNLSKKFKIGFKKKQTALSRAWTFISRREPKKEFWVLNNISFEVDAGEIIAIIGSNGSGKSTLLRTITGIYKQDKGTIQMNGKVISIIGLQTGFKKKLSMKENIFLCGSLLGIDKKSLDKYFNLIVSFAELEDYVDTKIYQFSTGMKKRVAISLAIYSVIISKAKILLLDEIFSGGDAHFKKKSYEKINDIIKSGISVLLVSHKMRFLKENCNRTIWMEKGKIIRDGPSKKVINEYLQKTVK